MNRLIALAAAAPLALLAGQAQTPAPPQAEVLRFEAPQRPIAVTLPTPGECRALLPADVGAPSKVPVNLDTEGTTRVSRLELRHPLGLAGYRFHGSVRRPRGPGSHRPGHRSSRGPFSGDPTVRDRLRVAYAGSRPTSVRKIPRHMAT